MQEGAGPGPDWSWGASQIPRGDFQTTFLFKGFDEARRLGLNRDTEAHVRAALAADAALLSTPGTALSHLAVMLSTLHRTHGNTVLFSDDWPIIQDNVYTCFILYIVFFCRNFMVARSLFMEVLSG